MERYKKSINVRSAEMYFMKMPGQLFNKKRYRIALFSIRLDVKIIKSYFFVKKP